MPFHDSDAGGGQLDPQMLLAVIAQLLSQRQQQQGQQGGLGGDLLQLGRARGPGLGGVDQRFGLQNFTQPAAGGLLPGAFPPFSGFAPSGPLVNNLGGSPFEVDPTPERLRNALAITSNLLGTINKIRREREAEKERKSKAAAKPKPARIRKSDVPR